MFNNLVIPISRRNKPSLKGMPEKEKKWRKQLSLKKANKENEELNRVARILIFAGQKNSPFIVFKTEESLVRNFEVKKQKLTSKTSANAVRNLIFKRIKK